MLDTEGGTRKRFDSVLLTQDDANRERLALLNDAHTDVEVFLDPDAVLEWERDKEAAKAEKKGKATKIGSHG